MNVTTEDSEHMWISMLNDTAIPKRRNQNGDIEVNVVLIVAE